MKGLATLFILIQIIVLSACATTSNAPSVREMLREATGQNGRACVRSTEISSYGTIRDNLVSIDGPRKHYIAIMSPGCLDLDTSLRTRLLGNAGEICGGSMHLMRTESDECLIRQMFEFDSQQQAFAMLNSILEKREILKKSETNSGD